MATLTLKVAALTGVDPLAYVSAQAGGDVFDAQAQSRYLIHVKNGHTSAQSIIIDDPTTAGPTGNTAFNPDVTVSVPNASERMILISSPARFINTTTGRISLSYSGVTALTLQVVRL
jgi:hypothetical protein